MSKSVKLTEAKWDFSISSYREGNDPEDSCSITYTELLVKVSKFANALKSLGVGHGDIVTIYMPMVLELVVAMLACARIGAVHSVVVSLPSLILPQEESQILLG